MSKKKVKAKKMTLRQRLRADAEDKLERMMESARQNVVNVVSAFDSAINPYDLLRVMSSSQTKSLRNRLIGELANETEYELEQLYNKQQDLTFGTKQEASDGNDKEKS